MKTDIKILYVDLFCGAGGTSTGVEKALYKGKKCAKVIACVNHDEDAIASHKANHPETLHFTEDIRTLDLTSLIAHVALMRLKYPNAKLVLGASLECTNFSNAKGGLPKDADSRTLANHLFRYIEALNPDIIQVENVKEFMYWGELDEKGKPKSKTAGIDYVRWTKAIQKYGYSYEWRLLCSADFGAFTIRERYFGQFAKKGITIAWPQPTHYKGGGTELFFFEKWKAVREVLDLNDEGKSIFTRKKPYCEKTLERIYSGLVRFVAGGKKEFLSKNYSGHPSSKNISLESPAHTVTTKDHHQLVLVSFLSGYYSSGENNSSINSPSPTVTTKDRFNLVQPQFFDMQYSNGTPMSINAPAGTVVTIPKQALISCTPVSKYFLMNPQYNNSGGSVNEPCFTLIARMDKAPPYLICTVEGNIAIAIYETDSPFTIKIKEFMAIYGLVDVKSRLLKIVELLRIMGFPENYILIGKKDQQKKFIGNAVEVETAKALCEVTAATITRSLTKSLVSAA